MVDASDLTPVKSRRSKPTVIEATDDPSQPVANRPSDVTHEPVPPASSVDERLTQGDPTMATAAETYQTTAHEAASSAQSMLGDINDRAKSAFEKSQQFGEELVDFSKGNVEAVIASARAAAKAGETMAQDAVDYGKRSFEQATSMLKGLTAAKTPTEFFQLQSDFARGAFDHAVAEASRGSERMVRVMNDVFQPLSSRYAVAAEKLKSAAL